MFRFIYFFVSCFLFLFFWFIFKIFLLIYFISALCMPTTTSDTFKNTPPAISKFSRMLFQRNGRMFLQVFGSFCKFLQGFASFIFSFRVFCFCFFWFIFKIFLLIYFISALCMPTTTSDTFKNTPPAISKFSRMLFQRNGRMFLQVFGSFCKFLQGFASFIFSFRVFCFCFLWLIFKIFLLIYFISALCEIIKQLLETLRIQTTTSDTFKNDRKQRSEDNS